MTIKIYPSIASEEALEEHQISGINLHDFFLKKVPDYQTREAKFFVVINGKTVPQSEWPLTLIPKDMEVSIYPIPRGAIGSVIGSIFNLVGSLLGVSSGASVTVDTGTELEASSTAKANTAKLGDPIREVFGKQRVYPDYLVAPVTRFNADNPEEMYTELFLCVGRGVFAFSSGDIRIGATPVDAFGDDVSYTKYEPGADVSADSRSDIWFVSSEVGGTTNGSGLDTSGTAPSSDDIDADSVTVSGTSVTFTGLDTDDDTNDNTLPDSFVVGATIELNVADDFAVSSSGLYSRLSANSLEEISPYVGMPVTLVYSGTNYDLYIANFSAYDSSTQTAAWVELAYNSATGTPFSGITTGNQSLALNHRGSEYKLITVDAPSIVVNRLIDGVVDTSWPGFDERTTLDFNITGINDADNWLGPFLACPSSETTSYFELNFLFSSGLISYSKKGKKRSCTVNYEIQYRAYGAGTNWISQTGSFTAKSINGVGYTVAVNPGSAGLYEVRVRRTNEAGEDNNRDSMFWQALQSRISAGPSNYAGVTTLALTVVVGDKLAVQSDRKVNVTATRVYDSGTARTVSAAIKHVADSVGLTNYDSSALDSLESSIWTPNNIFFDYIADDDSDSVSDVLNTIATAGRGYVTFEDGKVVIGYEGPKAWVGLVTAQDVKDSIESTATMPTDDDYDGVDVTYTSELTNEDETVQCRIIGGDTPKKIKTVTADGVSNEDKAYQYGMRMLMKYQYQRVSYKFSTEMLALNYSYGDRIKLSEDLPTDNMISCLMESCVVNSGVSTITVSEPLDWSYANPRVLIRDQLGQNSSLLTPTQIDDYSFSVTGDFSFSPLPIEPPMVLFCDSTQAGYDAVITEIEPNSDGTVDVTADEYKAEYYQYDSTTYPGEDAKRYTIALYGDSTVDGYLTTPYTKNPVNSDGSAKGNYNHTPDAPSAWPYLSSVKSLHTIYNCGYEGRAAVDGWARNNIDTAIFNNAALSTPDFILLDFGLNDYIRGNWSVATFKRYMGYLISYIKGKGCKVIIATSDPVSNRSERPFETVQSTLIVAQRQIASENDCLLFDKNAKLIQIGNWRSLQPDGLHFNNEGHILKSNIFLNFLTNNL